MGGKRGGVRIGRSIESGAQRVAQRVAQRTEQRQRFQKFELESLRAEVAAASDAISESD